MTDRPILFSAPMVRALLDGRKTQTRRVIKPQPTGIVRWGCFDGKGFGFFDRAGNKATRYHVGDRLWVKETWRASLAFNDTKPSDLPRRAVFWAADGTKSFDDFAPGKLRPSIFMPRWASRITLIVTDVRVQRVQDITQDDARAEGAWPVARTAIEDGLYRCWFRELWDSLNAERGFGWETNPWVAAISFTVHKTNIDAMGDAG